MPLSYFVLDAEWRPRQENDSCLFYRPEIFMSISAVTVEPLRDRRRTIPSRPFRSSLRRLIQHRYTAGRGSLHHPTRPVLVFHGTSTRSQSPLSSLTQKGTVGWTTIAGDGYVWDSMQG